MCSIAQTVLENELTPASGLVEAGATLEHAILSGVVTARAGNAPAGKWFRCGRDR